MMLAIKVIYCPFRYHWHVRTYLRNKQTNSPAVAACCARAARWGRRARRRAAAWPRTRRRPPAPPRSAAPGSTARTAAASSRCRNRPGPFTSFKWTSANILISYPSSVTLNGNRQICEYIVKKLLWIANETQSRKERHYYVVARCKIALASRTVNMLHKKGTHHRSQSYFM